MLSQKAKRKLQDALITTMNERVAGTSHVEVFRVLGLAFCDKHGKEYQVTSHSDECPVCVAEQARERTFKLIRDIEEAHKNAGHSTLVFGVTDSCIA